MFASAHNNAYQPHKGHIKWELIGRRFNNLRDAIGGGQARLSFLRTSAIVRKNTRGFNELSTPCCAYCMVNTRPVYIASELRMARRRIALISRLRVIDEELRKTKRTRISNVSRTISRVSQRFRLTSFANHVRPYLYRRFFIAVFIAGRERYRMDRLKSRQVICFVA